MVTVKLTGTFYYGPRGAKRPYGPGDAVDVPEGLAQALGLTPMAPPEPEFAPAVALDVLGMPSVVSDALITAGYTVETARAASDDELLAVKGIGPATLRQIRAALE